MKSYNILNITPEQEREFREDQAKEVKLAEALDSRIAFCAYTLIGINIIVFILMAANGVSVRDPQAGDLLRRGADYGPLTTHGEWWRLLTAMFLHFGVYHLAINMAVLASVGPLAERLFYAWPRRSRRLGEERPSRLMIIAINRAVAISCAMLS